MKTEALTTYFLIGSYKPIIKWLKETGVKTTQEAIDTIEPIVMKIVENYSDTGSTLQTCENIKKHYDKITVL